MTRAKAETDTTETTRQRSERTGSGIPPRLRSLAHYGDFGAPQPLGSGATRDPCSGTTTPRRPPRTATARINWQQRPRFAYALLMRRAEAQADGDTRQTLKLYIQLREDQLVSAARRRHIG